MSKLLADTVKEALEGLRDARRLSELAHAAGLPPSTLTRLISGEYRVRDDYAEAIRRALATLRDRYKAAATEMDGQAKLIGRAQRGKR